MLQKILFGWICIVLLACNDKKDPSTTAEFPKVIDSNSTSQLPPVSFSPPDVSPMDMVYFPSDYPLLKMTGKTTAPPLARIIYSRPHKGGRSIFGNLVKYNVPWRLGANESTELEFFSTATIQDKKIKPGKYILYCIPKDSTWTIVFNSDLYSWGTCGWW